MARPSAVVTAAIDANMDQIALAEQRLHEIDELRRGAAEIYHAAGLMRQGYAEAIDALRATNIALSVRLQSSGRRSVAA